MHGKALVICASNYPWPGWDKRGDTADYCWLNNPLLHNGILLIKKKIFSVGFVEELLLLMAVSPNILRLSVGMWERQVTPEEPLWNFMCLHTLSTADLPEFQLVKACICQKISKHLVMTRMSFCSLLWDHQNHLSKENCS